MTLPIDLDLLRFKLNPKYPPGRDLMAKLVLRDSNVIDMIVTTVVGENDRSLYTSKPTEWPNCKYWAEKYFILDQNTNMEATKTVPLPPLALIAYFFSLKKF